MHTIRPVIWSDPAVWRVAVLLAGLLLPPVLGLIGMVRGWKRRQAPRDGKISSLVLGFAALVNWLVFGFYLVSESIGGLSFNYHIGRFASVFLILSLLLSTLSVRASEYRLGILVANVLVLVMWFAFGYAPQHWLERVNFETVKVDDHPVTAMMYVGNPRRSEVEAIAVVHVPTVGDYYLDFSEETFREASKHEFVALPFGAWTWKAMSHGKFGPPLPFRNVNEYRIPLSRGRVLTIAF